MCIVRQPCLTVYHCMQRPCAWLPNQAHRLHGCRTLVKQEASQLSKLALRLMGVSVNAAGCERSFSQMGLTHTKLRNRLGWANTIHIAQLRQELHRDRPTRKHARVVAADDSTSSAAAEKPKPAEDQLMDMKALTSAAEFRLTVNEWIADIDAEERQAEGLNLAAYVDSPAVVKLL